MTGIGHSPKKKMVLSTEVKAKGLKVVRTKAGQATNGRKARRRDVEAITRSAERRSLLEREPLEHRCNTLRALVPATIPQGHIVYSNIRTELSVRIVLLKRDLRALVDFGFQEPTLANPNALGDQIFENLIFLVQRRLVQATNRTTLPGGMNKLMQKSILRELRMRMFRFLRLRNTVCPDIWCRTCHGTWCMGTRSVVRIVRAILLVLFVCIHTTPCNPVFGLQIFAKLHEPANWCRSNPFKVKCHIERPGNNRSSHWGVGTHPLDACYCDGAS